MHSFQPKGTGNAECKNKPSSLLLRRLPSQNKKKKKIKRHILTISGQIMGPWLVAPLCDLDSQNGKGRNN